jgi:hypothetical protein
MIQAHFRSPLFEVQVTPSRGSAPSSVVEHAIDLIQQRKRQAKRSAFTIAYDEAWCVMDVEAPHPHPSLAQALDRIRQKKILRPALCNPCFEYWLLLHFRCCQRPFASSQEAERMLRQHVGDYRKGQAEWAAFAPLLAQARENALRAMYRYGAEVDIPASNPSTNLHEMIDSLHKAMGL